MSSVFHSSFSILLLFFLFFFSHLSSCSACTCTVPSYACPGNCTACSSLPNSCTCTNSDTNRWSFLFISGCNVAHCECDSGYTLIAGSASADCSCSSTCRLTQTVPSGQCLSCLPTRFGPQCSGVCPPCVNGVCAGAGQINGTGQCLCQPSWLGALCQYSRNSTCSGRGTPDVNGECTCDNLGIFGRKCEFDRAITCTNQTNCQVVDKNLTYMWRSDYRCEGNNKVELGTNVTAICNPLSLTRGCCSIANQTCGPCVGVGSTLNYTAITYAWSDATCKLCAPLGSNIAAGYMTCVASNNRTVSDGTCYYMTGLAKPPCPPLFPCLDLFYSNLSTPASLSVDDRGFLYVADTSANAVLRYNESRVTHRWTIVGPRHVLVSSSAQLVFVSNSSRLLAISTQPLDKQAFTWLDNSWNNGTGRYNGLFDMGNGYLLTTVFYPASNGTSTRCGQFILVSVWNPSKNITTDLIGSTRGLCAALNTTSTITFSFDTTKLRSVLLLNNVSLWSVTFAVNGSIENSSKLLDFVGGEAPTGIVYYTANQYFVTQRGFGSLSIRTATGSVIQIAHKQVPSPLALVYDARGNLLISSANGNIYSLTNLFNFSQASCLLDRITVSSSSLIPSFSPNVLFYTLSPLDLTLFSLSVLASTQDPYAAMYVRVNNDPVFSQINTFANLTDLLTVSLSLDAVESVDLVVQSSTRNCSSTTRIEFRQQANFTKCPGPNCAPNACGRYTGVTGCQAINTCTWCLDSHQCVLSSTGCASGTIAAAPKLNSSSIGSVVTPYDCATVDYLPAVFPSAGWAQQRNFFYLPLVGGGNGSLTSCPSGSVVSGWKFSVCSSIIAGRAMSALRISLFCKQTPQYQTDNVQVYDGICDSTIPYANGGYQYGNEYLSQLGSVSCPNNSAVTGLGLKNCASNTALQWTYSCAPANTPSLGYTFTSVSASAACNSTYQFGSGVSAPFSSFQGMAATTCSGLESVYSGFALVACSDANNTVNFRVVAACQSLTTSVQCPVGSLRFSGSNLTVTPFSLDVAQASLANNSGPYPINTFQLLQCDPGYGPNSNVPGLVYTRCTERGVFDLNSTFSCSACSAGRYSNSSTQYTCVNCPINSYSVADGSSACVACGSRCSSCQVCSSTGDCVMRPGWCNIRNSTTGRVQCIPAITQFNQTKRVPLISDPNYLAAILSTSGGCSYCDPLIHSSRYTLVEDGLTAPGNNLCLNGVDVCYGGTNYNVTTRTPTSRCIECETCGGSTVGCVLVSANHCKLGSVCGCSIGGTCYALSSVNPSNPCQRASNMSSSSVLGRCTGSWVNDDSLTCDDVNSCSCNRRCSNGVCLFTSITQFPPCASSFGCTGNVGNCTLNPKPLSSLVAPTTQCMGINASDPCSIITYCSPLSVQCPAPARKSPDLSTSSFSFAFVSQSLPLLNTSYSVSMSSNNQTFHLAVSGATVACGNITYQYAVTNDSRVATEGCSSNFNMMWLSSPTLNQGISYTFSNSIAEGTMLFGIVFVYSVNGLAAVKCSPGLRIHLLPPRVGVIMSGSVSSPSLAQASSDTVTFAFTQAYDIYGIKQVIITVKKYSDDSVLRSVALSGNGLSLTTYTFSIASQPTGTLVYAEMTAFNFADLYASNSSAPVMLDNVAPEANTSLSFVDCHSSIFSHASYASQNSASSLLVCWSSPDMFVAASGILAWNYQVQAHSIYNMDLVNGWQTIKEGQILMSTLIADNMTSLSFNDSILSTETIYRFGFSGVSVSGLTSTWRYSNGVLIDTNLPLVGGVFVVNSLGSSGGPSQSLSYSPTNTTVINWKPYVDDSGVTIQWSSLSGIDHFEVAIGAQPHPHVLYDSVQAFSVVAGGSSAVEVALTPALVTNKVYYVTLKAVGENLLSSTLSSSPFLYDSTAPLTAGNSVSIVAPSGRTISFITQGFPCGFKFKQFVDDESNIVSMEYSIGTVADPTSLFGFTSIPVTQTFVSVYLPSSAPLNTSYVVTVRGFNGAGSSSQLVSDSFLYDSFSVSAGVVFHGLSYGDFPAFQLNNDSLSANWDNFTLGGPAIQNYQYLIDQCQVNTTIVDWTDVGNVKFVEVTGLSLLSDAEYCFSVRAQNLDTSSTSPAQTSQSKLIITTEPNPDDMHVTDGMISGGVAQKFQTNFTSFFCSWFPVPERIPFRYRVSLESIQDEINLVGQTVVSEVLVDNGIYQHMFSSLSLSVGIYRCLVCFDSPSGSSLCSAGDGVAVDFTPPRAGVVKNGQSTVHQALQSFGYAIRANWFDFDDEVSGVAYFTVAVGRTPGASDLMSPRAVGTVTATLQSGIFIPDNTTFYITVTCYDFAGLSSSATSPPVYLTSNFPINTFSPVSSSSVLNHISVNSTVHLLDAFNDQQLTNDMTLLHWSIGTTPFGSELVAYTSMSNITLKSVIQSFAYTFQQEQHPVYFINILQDNRLNEGVFATSHRIVIDTTPPMLPSSSPLRVVRPDGSTLLASSDPSVISLAWGKPIDEQTQVIMEQVAIGTSEMAQDIWYHNFSDIASLNDRMLTLTGFGSLKHGDRVYISLKLTNEVLLQRIYSVMLLIDLEAPTAPNSTFESRSFVFPHASSPLVSTGWNQLEADVEFCQASLSTLSMSWKPFQAISGIASYQWRVENSLGVVLLPWTTVLINAAVHDGFKLHDGDLLIVTVRATSQAGLSNQITTKLSISTMAPSLLNPDGVLDGSEVSDISYSATSRLLSAHFEHVFYPAHYYSYSVGTTTNGQQIIPNTYFTDPADFSIVIDEFTRDTDGLVLANVTLQPGYTYSWTIAAYSCSGFAAIASSNGFVYDPLPPTPSSVSLGSLISSSLSSADNGHLFPDSLRLYVQSKLQQIIVLGPNDNIVIQWTPFTPSFTSIAYYSVAIINQYNHTVYFSQQLPNNSTSLIIDPNLYSFNSYTLYSIVVSASNSVGVTSNSSVSFVFDFSAPVPGSVTVDGTRCPHNQVGLSVKWDAFQEQQSYIVDYKYCIAETLYANVHDLFTLTPSLCDVAPVTTVGLETHFSLDSLQLQAEHTYYVYVEGRNAVNLTAYVTSQPIVVKSFTPLPMSVSASGAVNTSLSETVSSSNHIAVQWTPFFNTSNVTYFIAFGTTAGGFQLSDFQSVATPFTFSQFTFHQTFPLSVLPSGVRVYPTVKAITCHGVEIVAFANYVLFDHTPPIIEQVTIDTLVHNDLPSFSNSSALSTSITILNVTSPFVFAVRGLYDPESFVSTLSFSISSSSSSPLSADVLAPVSFSLSSAVSHSLSSTEPYQVQNGISVSIDNSTQSEKERTLHVTLDLNIPWQMQHYYYLNVEATNGAAIVSSSSSRFVFDQFAPLAGDVWFVLDTDDHLSLSSSFYSSARCVPHSSPLILRWSPFVTIGAATLTHYELALSTTPQLTNPDIRDFTPIPLVNTYTLYADDIPLNSTFYALIRASSSNGLSTTALSAPVLFTHAPSTPLFTQIIDIGEAGYSSDQHALNFSLDIGTPPNIACNGPCDPSFTFIDYQLEIFLSSESQPLVSLSSLYHPPSGLTVTWQSSTLALLSLTAPLLSLPSTASGSILLCRVKSVNCAQQETWARTLRIQLDFTQPDAHTQVNYQCDQNTQVTSKCEEFSNSVPFMWFAPDASSPDFSSSIAGSVSVSSSTGILLAVQPLSDVESGLALYDVSIGSTPGGSDITSQFSLLTTNTNSTSSDIFNIIQLDTTTIDTDIVHATMLIAINTSSLSLSHASIYYVTVNSVNRAGLTFTSSLSFVCDVTPPVLPAVNLASQLHLSDGVSIQDSNCQLTPLVSVTFWLPIEEESTIVAYQWGIATQPNSPLDALDIQQLTTFRHQDVKIIDGHITLTSSTPLSAFTSFSSVLVIVNSVSLVSPPYWSDGSSYSSSCRSSVSGSSDGSARISNKGSWNAKVI